MCVQRPGPGPSASPQSPTRAGVILFEPTSSTAEVLLGRSSLYGEVSVPLRSLLDLELLAADGAPGGGTFALWVTHPAPEPSWDD